MEPKLGMFVVVWIGQRPPSLMPIANVYDKDTILVVNCAAQHYLKRCSGYRELGVQPPTHSWDFQP